MTRVLAILLAMTFLASVSARAAGDEAGRAAAKAHTELGTAYFQAGRMAVALEEAAHALEADSSYAPAYNLSGLVNMFLRDTDKAREAFEKALKHAPGDAEISNNYGWLLCQEGREKDAFPYFMQAVRNPLYLTPTRPFFNAGMCALRLKDDARAEDYFSKAVMADPGNMRALFHLAEIKYRADNLYEAQRLVGAVMQSSADDPAALWLALRIERKMGNRPAEQGFATQLRRKFQGTPEYQAMIQGRFE